MSNFVGVNTDRETAKDFKAFLRDRNIYFEPSECYSDIYFEVKTDKKFSEIVTDFENWSATRK